MTQEIAPVFITGLQAERFKRLRAVTMIPTPEGLTVIGGRNLQGKTSILDSIMFTLGGEKYRPTDEQNHDSKEPPYNKVVLSNGLIVERKGKKGALQVTHPDGLKGSQGLLDKFIDKLALDLPKFMQATSPEKAKILLKIIGVNDDLEQIERKEKSAYERRRDAGKVVDNAQKLFDACELHPESPEELIVVADVVEKLRVATAEQADYDNMTQTCANHKSRIAQIHKELAESEASLKADEKTLMTLPERLDIPELQAKIGKAEIVNDQVRANQQHAEKKVALEVATAEHLKIGKELTDARTSKSNLLDGAVMPLEGLAIADGELIYKGYNWDGMGESEKLKVAVSIVRKLTPACGFVLMDKLEQMDVETLNDFGKWAKEQKLQIIATRVSTGDECTLIIEDGEVLSPETKEESVV